MFKATRRRDAEARVNLGQKRSWFVDVTQTAANVRFGANAVRVRMQSGEAFGTGQPLYIKAADSLMYRTDADASAEAGLLFGYAGVRVEAANIWFDVVTWDDDCTPGFTLTKGIIYIPSATAGGIAPIADCTTGWYLNVGMIPKSTSKCKLVVINSGVVT